MTLFFGALVFNNTVINRFTFPSFDKREADPDVAYEAPLEFNSDGSAILECTGVQGDHEVIWSTDNTVVGNFDSVVNCDTDRPNHQELDSNYSSVLVNIIQGRIQGGGGYGGCNPPK